jgi:prevent-host-death family protein
MTTVSVAEAKDRLASLVKEAESGETVTITRHGRAVAELRPVGTEKFCDPLSLDRIRGQLAHIPRSDKTGAEIVSEMRDEDWH